MVYTKVFNQSNNELHIESLCDYGNFLCSDPCDESTCAFVFEIPEIITIPELDPDWCPWCPICLTCPPDWLDIFTDHEIGPVVNPVINPGIGGPKLGNSESSPTSNGSFNLFPNPTNEMATIKLNQDSSLSHRFTVFDLSGKIIQQSTFESKQTNVDLSDVAKGLYMVQIQNNETKNVLSTKKLLVK